MATTPAEPLADRLRSLFAAELADAVRALTEGLLRLESGPAAADAGDTLRELFRVAHGIKGAAHSAGIAGAVAAARRLEEGLAALRSASEGLVPDDVARLLVDVDELAAVHRELTGDVVAPADGRRTAPAEPSPVATRVPLAKVDAVAAGVRELAATAHGVERLAADLATLADDPATGDRIRHVLDGLADGAMATARRLNRLSSELVDDTSDLMLRPFVDACDGLARVVRDLATDDGKDAQLRIVGGHLELDRAVVAALREPLLHLVRNAVDHGLEPPDERVAAGKPRAGVVEVRAAVDEGRLEVRVRDDGRGIDVEALRAAARTAGVETDEAEDEMELAFAPGVSTAMVVTDVSGRGIGLDAVRDRIEAVGGTVSLATALGEATVVTLVLPVTLTVLPVLAVRVAGEVVCIPVVAVRRMLAVDASAIRPVEGRSVLVDGDGPSLPVAPFAAVLGFGDGSIPAGRVRLVAVGAGGRDVALAVDELLDAHDLVVRPTPARLAGIPELLGVGTLPDGAPVLVVNPAHCVRQALSTASGTSTTPATSSAARRTRVLLAEDTLTTRTLEQSILEAAGYEVLAAADGAEAWQLLRRHGADLVVTDVHMPRMDGFELCRTIRRSDRFAQLPVVLVTSLGSDDDRRAGVEAGANAYVAKADFSQEVLLDVIGRHV